MPPDAASAWDALEEPWRLCLSLAWEAYGAGTIPVGAVLVDGSGAVVAEGRNRIYEPLAPPRHAEVNALVALTPSSATRTTCSTRHSSRACCASAPP